MKVGKIKKLREGEISYKLYIICSSVTIVVMVMVLIEFFSRGLFSITKISPFYVGILLIYSLHKEFIRWLGEGKKEGRKGERFVYTWIGITFLLYLIDFFTKGYFTQTSEGKTSPVLENLNLITLEVGTIFLLTKFTKVVSKIAKNKFKI